MAKDERPPALAPSVSRGIYLYCRNGAPADIEETWEIFDEGGARRIRSQRRAPGRGAVLAVESWHRDGAWQRCDLAWRQMLDGKPVQASACYRFAPSALEIALQGPNGAARWREADLDFLFSPLLRIYSGETIRRLHARGGRGRVLVPRLGDGRPSARFLGPSYSQRQAQLIGQARLRLGSARRDCLEYRYQGGPYVPAARFWVDERGLTLRYRWQQDETTSWEVSLQEGEGLAAAQGRPPSSEAS